MEAVHGWESLQQPVLECLLLLGAEVIVQALATFYTSFRGSILFSLTVCYVGGKVTVLPFEKVELRKHILL